MTGNTSNIIIAYCGLCCTNCGAYKKGKCKGCHSEKPMNRRCKMKACAIEHEYTTCADCTDFQNLKDCKKLNNLIANFFGLILGTNRIGNLYQIRETGIEKFKEKKILDGKQ